MFLNDVLRIVFPFDYLMIAYTDDFTVAARHKDPYIATQHLQKICNGISRLCADNKLGNNALKTILMVSAEIYGSTIFHQ